jgi:hypothetical protein
MLFLMLESSLAQSEKGGMTFLLSDAIENPRLNLSPVAPIVSARDVGNLAVLQGNTGT